MFSLSRNLTPEEEDAYVRYLEFLSCEEDAELDRREYLEAEALADEKADQDRERAEIDAPFDDNDIPF